MHGSWTTAFVQGRHEYLVPVMPDRGPDGRGRAQTWDWPAPAVEVPAPSLRDEPIRRRRPAAPARGRAARAAGRARGPADLPAVYVEHNTPQGRGGHPPPGDAEPAQRHTRSSTSRISTRCTGTAATTQAAWSSTASSTPATATPARTRRRGRGQRAGPARRVAGTDLLPAMARRRPGRRVRDADGALVGVAGTRHRPGLADPRPEPGRAARRAGAGGGSTCTRTAGPRSGCP